VAYSKRLVLFCFVLLVVAGGGRGAEGGDDCFVTFPLPA
jgi:hypothetical protein